MYENKIWFYIKNCQTYVLWLYILYTNIHTKQEKESLIKNLKSIPNNIKEDKYYKLNVNFVHKDY